MKNYLSLVKFSHTIFAFPFAVIGFLLAYQDNPNTQIDFLDIVLVVLCMIFARTAAMAFNRYLDRDIDASNPRTQNREIPSGIISPQGALLLVLFSSFSFIVTTFFLNPLVFYLSPVALTVVLGYSFSKRFTSFSHLILGIGLGLAPIGAYLAIVPVFTLIPVLLGLMVLLWVSGFDIIYALQDEEFDKKNNLQSIPAWLGANKALKFSKILHLICAILIIAISFLMSHKYSSIGLIFWAVSLFFITMLWIQQKLVKPGKLEKVNLAFFTTNGIASVIYGVGFLIDSFI
jgi:4-hydroxybenzoate polyprenyltransferase